MQTIQFSPFKSITAGYKLVHPLQVTRTVTQSVDEVKLIESENSLRMNVRRLQPHDMLMYSRCLYIVSNHNQNSTACPFVMHAIP